MEHFSMRLRTHAKKLSARQTRRCCGLASAKETPFVSASAITVGQSQDSSSRRGTGVSVRRRSTGSKARGKVNASQKANRGARKGLPSCRVRTKGNRPSYQYQSPRNKVGIWERAYRWLEDNDLARRSLITVVAVITSRLCFLLPIPGLDKRFLTDAFANGPLIGVKDPFSGFLETPGNLFQVGFTPIVFSSIVTMTLCASVPYLKQKRREGGAGEIFLKNLQLYIFLVFAVIWSVVTTGSIAPYKIFGSNFEIFSTLLCGSLILKTMCTLIDTYGIGDGFLNILVANIIIEYMVLFRFTLSRFMQGQLLLPQLLGLFASVICCVLASAWLIGSTVNLPIKYYATDQEVADGYGSKESYLPFKLNPTGMQPLIMAQCVLQAPTLFANMFRNSFWFGLARFLEQPSVFIPVYFLLLFSSAFLDVSETSKEISLWMSKIGALVPGVRPGQSTTDYVENFRRKTIVKGGLMLSTLGTASLLVESYFKTSMGITFSLTSMLLLVAAFVTVRRQVISYQQAPKLEATIKEYEKVMDSAMKSPFQ